MTTAIREANGVKIAPTIAFHDTRYRECRRHAGNVLQCSELEIYDVAAFVDVRDLENEAATIGCFNSKVLVALTAQRFEAAAESVVACGDFANLLDIMSRRITIEKPDSNGYACWCDSLFAIQPRRSSVNSSRLVSFSIS